MQRNKRKTLASPVSRATRARQDLAPPPTRGRRAGSAGRREDDVGELHSQRPGPWCRARSSRLPRDRRQAAECSRKHTADSGAAAAGMKIAVIENEFGEVNIDEALVSENMQFKEDVVSMDNGCATPCGPTLASLPPRHPPAAAARRARAGCLPRPPASRSPPTPRSPACPAVCAAPCAATSSKRWSACRSGPRSSTMCSSRPPDWRTLRRWHSCAPARSACAPARLP